MTRSGSRLEPLLVLVGFLGCLAVAAGSYVTGATPASFRTHVPAVVDLVGQRSAAALALYYGGLGLLTAAWLVLLRIAVFDGRPLHWTGVASWAWSVPLVLCCPVGSRDVWAYLAQADVAAHGRNPYEVSPAMLPSRFVPDMTPHWTHTTSPYGALWTLLTRWLLPAVESHALVAALAFKLLNGIGFVLLVAAARVIARRLRVRADVAVLATALSPLLLVHLLGGGHNDLLMIGLVAAGLAVVLGRGGATWRLLAAGALIGLAVAVKLPAVVVLPFLPLLRAHAAGERPAPARVGRELALAVGGFLVPVLVVTGAAGYGFGWVTAGNTAEHGGGALRVVVTLAVLVAVWIASLRLDPRYGVVLALLVVIVISPSVLIWYWAWPVALLVLVPLGRVPVFAVAVLELVLLAAVKPIGQSAGVPVLLLAPLAAVVVAVALLPGTTRRARTG